MQFRQVLCAIAVFICITPGHAWSKVAVQYETRGKYAVIRIDSSLTAEDGRRFKQIARDLDDAIVVLSSDGGSLTAAMEIGEQIAEKSFTTYVLQGHACLSECAIVWIAGAERYAGSASSIGFKGLYQGEGTKHLPSVSENVLLGAYLAKLGLSTAFMKYTAEAGPAEFRFFNADTARRYNISAHFGEIPQRKRKAAPGLDLDNLEMTNLEMTLMGPDSSSKTDLAVPYSRESQKGNLSDLFPQSALKGNGVPLLVATPEMKTEKLIVDRIEPAEETISPDTGTGRKLINDRIVPGEAGSRPGKKQIYDRIEPDRADLGKPPDKLADYDTKFSGDYPPIELPAPYEIEVPEFKKEDQTTIEKAGPNAVEAE